jgi:acetoin utilization deacetylase AcuC-like enzyme
MVKLSALVHCLVVQTATSTMAPAIHVVSRYLPGEGLSKSAAEGGPVLNAADARNDNMDLFNHPRIRRALILQSMNDIDAKFIFETPSAPSKNLDDYKLVCSDPLLEFFSTAYDRWHAMGAHGQDPDSTRTLEEDLDDISHPLIPGNVLLPREPFQRPSNNVMGQIGYYCTDTLTPVFKELKEELLWDSAVVKQAIERLKDPKSNNMVYALGTHPGHHASFDSFGGYCYLNVRKAENKSTALSTCAVVSHCLLLHLSL